MKNFDPPRWPSGRPICRMANLPAFESTANAVAFKEINAPSTRIIKLWLCPHCDGWHYSATSPSPSGASSGTERT